MSVAPSRTAIRPSRMYILPVSHVVLVVMLEETETVGLFLISITPVVCPFLSLLSVIVSTTDPAPTVLAAVKVTTTLPEFALAAGSVFTTAVPPVAVAEVDLYPPSDVNGNVISTDLSSSTSAFAGAVRTVF